MIRSGTIDNYIETHRHTELVALVVGARHAPWRTSLCEGLKRQGYRVMVASSPERALCRFEKHRAPIQVVIVGGEETAWCTRKLAGRIKRISPATHVIAV